MQYIDQSDIYNVTCTHRQTETEKNRSYIFVVDTFHQDQFSVGPFGVGLVLKGSAKFLNCNISFKDMIVR